MKALVIGRGKGVWDEVAIADQACVFDFVVVINSVGCDYKCPDKPMHWATDHVEKLPHWVFERRMKGYPPAAAYWGPKTLTQGHFKKPALPISLIKNTGGSSGMIGTYAALRLGASKVVLAGIPMTAEAEHYDEAGPWKEAPLHRKAWLDLPQDMKDKIRSLSGWTQELLGAPMKDWLDGTVSN